MKVFVNFNYWQFGRVKRFNGGEPSTSLFLGHAGIRISHGCARYKFNATERNDDQ